MTAICSGGGPSQPKAGVAVLQNLSPDAVVAFLYGEGWAWFAAVAYGVGYLAYDLSGLCASDPPALPNVDAARLFGYTNPLNPHGAADLLQDASAIVGYLLWFSYCECVTGPAPTPVNPPAPPAGQQTNNPVLNQPSPNNCSSGSLGPVLSQWDSHGNDVESLNVSPAAPATAQWYELGLTTGYGPDTSALPYPISGTVQELDTNRNVLKEHQVQVPIDSVSHEITYRYSWNPAIQHWNFIYHTDQPSPSNVYASQAYRLYCSPAPVSLEQPCCPPDPNLLQLVNQVLQLEQLILATLGKAAAYTLGTAHTGLTGTGSLPIQQLRGILVNVTQGTPTVPQLPGNPPYEWNLGWMSVMDGNGLIQERRITRSQQVWLPQDGELATTFGFYLTPGVVCTFTELEPAA